jgi:hypothetical protein
MYCKECGTENKDDSLRCSKCNTYLKSSNSPLTGGNRTKIISFFAFLILPFVWFGGSVLIILIAIFALYIMKKDQSFTPIINAKKYMKAYLIFSALSITVASSIVYYKENKTIINYEKYNYAKQYKSYVSRWDYEEHNPSVAMQTGMVAIGGLIATPFVVGFFMFIFNSLFFRPLEEHKNWIIKNGIFSDEKDKKADSTNMVGRDNLSSYSVADELLKKGSDVEYPLIQKKKEVTSDFFPSRPLELQ